jgi:hypothetical protein
VGTLLDRVTATNAQMARNIADVQAALPDAQAALTKAVLAMPGAREEFAAAAVRDAQAGGKPVSLALLDSVLAGSGLDISQRIAEKEIMFKAGMVRG